MPGPGPTRSVVRLAVAFAATVLTVLGSLVIAHPAAGQVLASQPDSHQQPLVDGCQRSNAMDLTLSTPEWVYVNRSDVLAARLAGDTTVGQQTVEGVVDSIHPAGDDLYVNHDYNDLDIGVQPDPQYMNLVASGNGGDLGTEWEATLMPTWAWPQVGDRVRESGSWIWDCGHWGNGPADDSGGVSQLLPYDPEETLKDLASPGAISGEQTELHPLYQVATWRKDAAGVLQGVKGGRNLQRLDVWINGDGGPALSEEECALYGPGSLGAVLPQVCPRSRDVGGTYTYVMKVGPKAGTLIVNPIVMHPETDPTLRSVPITITRDEQLGTVTVSFTLPHQPVPQHFGITVEAGWSNAPAAVHHVVTLNAITINATLDGPSEPNINPITSAGGQESNPVLREQTPNPGEWVLYAQVNGQWRQLDPSRLSHVSKGDVIKLKEKFDYWLPAGVAPTLYVSGRECDIPYIDCRNEHYGAPPTGTSPFTEAGFNDKPGRIELGNTGLPLTPGEAIYEPLVNPVPTSSVEDYSDAACGGPCYSLTATSR